MNRYIGNRIFSIFVIRRDVLMSLDPNLFKFEYFSIETTEIPTYILEFR